MRVDVVTIFPEYLAPLRAALLGRAIERGLIDIELHDLRDWTHDVHRAVDDSPYGGGPGMVMRPDVWGEALDSVCAPRDELPGTEPLLVVPTPSGRPFTQTVAHDYAARQWLVFACGRYEGIDERVLTDAARRMPVDEVSIGDYVLVGGEVAVLAIVEAVARLLPGVLGNPASAEQDSFSAGCGGLLEGPSYTRPETWRELAVPDVLRSGNHAAIEAWRCEQALRRTLSRRPELLGTPPGADLPDAERAVLRRLLAEDAARG